MLNEFLQQNKILICIPTKGRIGRQKTIKCFPEECLGESVCLVHSRDESHEYPGIIQPESINNIRDKRNFIIDYAQNNNYNYLIMLDDDATIKSWDTTISRWIPSTESQIVEAIKLGMDWDYYSLGGRFFNNGDLGLKENTTGNAFHMFNLKTLGTIRARTPIFEDADLYLQLFRIGGTICCNNDCVFDNTVDNKFGGNASNPNFSDDELFEKNIDYFLSLNSDFVSKEKTAGKFRGKCRGYKLKIKLKRNVIKGVENAEW